MRSINSGYLSLDFKPQTLRQPILMFSTKALVGFWEDESLSLLEKELDAYMLELLPLVYYTFGIDILPVTVVVISLLTNCGL